MLTRIPPVGRVGRRSAFTIVELLVVVSLIAVLVAMLLPALARTHETTRRSVCTANLHQMGIATYAYAADSRGSTPVGQPNWPSPGLGIEVCYYIGPSAALPFPTNRVWYGTGLLFGQGYVDNGKPYFCPSATYIPFTYEPQKNWFLYPGQMDGYLAISYQYRCTDNNWQPYNLSNDPPTKGLISDLWVSGWLPTYLHMEGANTLYLDGSAKFIGEPLLSTVSGAPGSTNTSWGWQETVWRTCIDR